MTEWKVKQNCSFTTERLRNMALNSYFGQIDWSEISYALSPYRGYITPLSAFQATSIPPPLPTHREKFQKKGHVQRLRIWGIYIPIPLPGQEDHVYR